MFIEIDSATDLGDWFINQNINFFYNKLVIFLFFFLLFIYAYNVWVISPPSPLPPPLCYLDLIANFVLVTIVHIKMFSF
jgi:hypothetical protein